MTAYVPERSDNIPADGDRYIQHLVKLFSGDNLADIQDDINDFLASLTQLPNHTPYIERIDFDTHYKTSNPRYSIYNAMVHYRLMGIRP